MSNALYFPKTRLTEKVCERIATCHKLKLDYDKRTQRSYSNDQLLMLIAQKYIMLYIFDYNKEKIARDILNIIYEEKTHEKKRI